MGSRTISKPCDTSSSRFCVEGNTENDSEVDEDNSLIIDSTISSVLSDTCRQHLDIVISSQWESSVLTFTVECWKSLTTKTTHIERNDDTA